MNVHPGFQSALDTCLLPLAYVREILRKHNPFGDKNRSSFARRKWLGGIRKFAEVNPGVYLGSSPSVRALKQLRKYGIKAVVNLRASYDYHDAAEALGLRYFAIPLNGKRPPLEEEIVKFLRLVEDQENQPVFFHCNRARNRTYMLLGLYRIAHDSWSADQAIAEMKHFGWRNIPDGMVSFLESYANGGLKRIR